MHSIHIALMGDVMIGRGVDNAIEQVGYDYPFAPLEPLLRNTDLNIINLETTLTTSSSAVAKVFNFKASPDRVEILRRAHITIANIANNHILDFDKQGMFDTIQTLDNAGICHTGAGNNAKAAQAACIFVRDNVRIGVIGATDNEPTWAATATSAGTNYFNVQHPEPLINQIKKLRKTVDIIIVSLHWGPNMREYPDASYIACAHALIDAGADIIHGHSAHVIQGFQWYQQKLILYDTGDFVDDYAIDPALRNDLSCLFIVSIEKNRIEQLQLIPTVIKDMQVHRATGAESDAIFSLVRHRCALFPTTTISTSGISKPT